MDRKDPALESPPTRVAVYLRVSAESDLSIPDQRRQLTSYAEAKGWLVTTEFVEPNASLKASALSI